MKKALAAALLVAFFNCIAPVAAGTTGSLTGRVVDTSTQAPVAAVKVTAVSDSQTATVTTDSSGAFAFISLSPDTYTISAEKAGYDPQSQPGITIFSDQSSTIGFSLHASIKEIGAVRSQSNSSLVRAGTTSDVYSVDAAGQRASKGLGGSGSLDQAYGAIASVPGVSIPSGQQGWYQSVFIRGGDYDQVAYEFDGVPVLRQSDGAPIVTLSALGQQEVQVYTGGTPATSDSPGLAGYINQVIKTGTHPGYAIFNAAVGSPSFYHKFSAEAGGASPNRLFSYYVGLAAANQDYRYGDQSNGAGDPLYSYPLAIPSTVAGAHILDGSCGTYPVPVTCTAPYGAAFSPGNSWAQSNNNDRETVLNLHVGIPHKSGTGRDDVQLLYVTGSIFTKYFSSANDLGLAAPSAFLDGTAYTGQLLAAPDPTKITPNAFFPSSPGNRTSGSAIPINQRDGGSNDYSVTKLQYQRNFNDHSYLRAIGYGEYSTWFLNGPNSAFQTFGATLADYEVLGHIFGGSLIYSNSLSSKHLLTGSLSYSTQKLQTYNATFANGANTGQFGSIISNYAAQDAAGMWHCYDYTLGIAASCYGPASQGNPTVGLAPAAAPVPGVAASFIMTENGRNAQVDNVTPYFSSVALTDVMKPNDKLTINAGLRFDRFSYRREDLASGYPARQFWFDAYNNEHCSAPGLSNEVRPPGGPCPEPVGNPTLYTAMTNPGFGFTNTTGGIKTDSVLQPRIAFTYLANRNTVIRGSYGRYARPAATSYQQYNTYQQDLPSFISQFSQLGYTSPNHDVAADTSDNFDLSYERRIPGTSLSIKASPFYRTTKNQLQYLNINALGGTLAGINVGTLRSYGLEFALRAGDFAKDGFSGQLSYTYTNTHTRYKSLPNGLNLIDVLNQSIEQYNSYTGACAGAASVSKLCGSGALAGNAAPTLASTTTPGLLVP
ncbi:MAG: TonB-dependent receptor, partial [Candidatus Eremiobacteraeota bacterium]|nr:TonB-dependent receptor [Candidatus Eremiobacteraeota bacterium]